MIIRIYSFAISKFGFCSWLKHGTAAAEKINITEIRNVDNLESVGTASTLLSTLAPSG